jgi:hypothetical protein
MPVWTQPYGDTAWYSAFFLSMGAYELFDCSFSN